MPLQVTVTGVDKVKRKLKGTPDRVASAIDTTLGKVLAMIQRYIQTEKLSHSQTPPPGDQGLAYRSGNLFRSIHVRRWGNQYTKSGSVYLGEEAWYGKLHELGGTFVVQPHTRRKFHVTSGGHKTKKVDSILSVPQSGEPYTLTFPRRSFMASSVRELKAEIKEQFGVAIRLELKG